MLSYAVTVCGAPCFEHPTASKASHDIAYVVIRLSVITIDIIYRSAGEPEKELTQVVPLAPKSNQTAVSGIPGTIHWIG